MSQIAVRIPDTLLHELDELIAAGRYETRAQAIRAGLVSVLERERQQRIDDAIIEGYRKMPPSAVEERWAEASGRTLIAEEPW